MFHAVDRHKRLHTAASPTHLSRGNLRIGLVALAAALALAGCNDDGNANKTASTATDNAAANQAPAAQPAVVQAAYTPPSADVLYQMVAPIALYPDKLVAQILAGSTYPDQVSAAETWLAQNPGLKAAALSNAANAQPWDPSVKSLTLFPNVLGQMASNLPWTTALGKAYYNDPADVMNAIQVMRGRAYKAGSLKDSSHLKVKLVTEAPPQKSYIPADTVPLAPVSAPVIAPPQQFIEIAPSEPSTVYVPQYNPTVVYGTPVPVYSGYSYVVPPPPPPPVVVGGFATPVVAGLIGFGVGVAVTEVIGHPWGWNAWHVHWGEPGQPGYWVQGNRPPPPLARPAVVYNNQTYISNSTTVVQNIHNINNVHVVNNGSVVETARPAMAIGGPPGHGPALAAGVAAAAAGAAGGYALAQRQPVGAPNMPSAPGAQPMAHTNAMMQMQQPQGPNARTAPAPNNQRPGGLTMAQQMAQPQSRPQSMEVQRAQQEQMRQQQMAQQRTQQDQMHQQQMAQQRAQQDQMHQQQMAQQRAQQDQMHQQQMAQQRAQQEQMHQQQMAQQRTQQEQMHQQQMAQQRAQQDQMRQQQVAQQRAEQEQMHQQQMAQQRAQQEQMQQQMRAQQHAQQQAMQHAQEQQMRQQPMGQQAHPQPAFHPQPHEGRHGEHRER